MRSNPVAFALHLVGYPTAVVVIARWIPVVRQRRLKWFLAHQAGVAAIVAGWAIVGRRQGVVVNAAWGLIAGAWYALGGRARTSRFSPAERAAFRRVLQARTSGVSRRRRP